MILNVKFIAGHLANRTYVYKNKDKFSPGLFTPNDKPLYLSDFKSLEIIAQPGIRPATAKCTFINGEESLIIVNIYMLKFLQTYLYNKSKATNENEIIIPKCYDDILMYILFGAIAFPFGLYIYRHFF